MEELIEQRKKYLNEYNEFYQDIEALLDGQMDDKLLAMFDEFKK
jgi:hypothetical protein